MIALSIQQVWIEYSSGSGRRLSAGTIDEENVVPVLKELLYSEEDEHLWHRLLLPTPNLSLP